MKHPSVAIIILAAGSSSRMHLPKQLLPYKRKNLLQHTLDEAIASKSGSVYIVLGAHAKQIQKAVRNEKAQILLNHDWVEGMSSSIRSGIQALPESVDAAIISLCDQPFITSVVFDSLIETFLSSGKAIIACEYGGSPGVPVLFAKKYFPELALLQGDSGARTIIQSHRDDVTFIQFPNGSVDLDTPEEYKEFIGREFNRSTVGIILQPDQYV